MPSGTTPRRMDRKYPQKIVEGTPDDIRIKSFQSSIDARYVLYAYDYERIDWNSSTKTALLILTTCLFI